MHILLLQDDETTREKVAFVLEGQFNAKVTHVGSADDARTILKAQRKNVSLIVIDVAKAKSREADKLRSEFSDIQTIIFLQGPPEKRLAISAPPGHPLPLYVDRGDIVQNLIVSVGGLIKQSMLPNPDDDRNFCKIRTKLLLPICPLESDVYIRLSEAKYLKLMRQGDQFDLQDMEKYTVKKGVEFLYIRKDNIQDFIKKYQAELVSYLDRKPEMGIQEVISLNESVFETVQELGSTLGFTPQVQEMSKTQVQLTVKAMGKSPRLSKLFDKLESFQGKYIAAHSTMTGYLACAIASQMKWGSETTFYKLTMASFLHDITLSNHELAKCTSLEDVAKGSFTDDEKRAFKVHTVQAAEVAKQFSEVPPDVDVIIAQHHERADGTGFPRGLASSYIAPLAAIFIVAHDMAQFASEKGPSFKVPDFIAVARERYKPSQFRKVVQAIEQL